MFDIVITGSSSAPRLTVMSMLTSFILTPQAPEDNPQCVTNYNIIPAGNDSVVRMDIPVAIEDLGVAILVDGYDVCLYTYNFTIISTTLTGELMRTVSQDDPLDLSGNFIQNLHSSKCIATGRIIHSFTLKVVMGIVPYNYTHAHTTIIVSRCCSHHWTGGNKEWPCMVTTS